MIKWPRYRRKKKNTNGLKEAARKDNFEMGKEIEIKYLSSNVTLSLIFVNGNEGTVAIQKPEDFRSTLERDTAESGVDVIAKEINEAVLKASPDSRVTAVIIYHNPNEKEQIVEGLVTKSY